MVSLNRIGRREGAIIALIALTYWGTVYGIPLPNTSEWRSYFKRRDFKDRTVPPLIAKLKVLESHSPELQKELDSTAQKGAAVLPYAAELSGERRLRFFMTIPHAGIVLIHTVRPYQDHASMLVARVSDPEALPALMRLAVDRDLGGAAVAAINRINASLPPGAPVPRIPKEIALKLIINAAHWLKPFSIEPAELRLMTTMDEKEAISLFNQIAANRLAPCPGLSTSENYYWHLEDYSQKDLDNFSRFLDAVGRLGDPGSLCLINGQAYGLYRDVNRSKTDAAHGVSPETMDKMERLLRMYRRCLGELSRRDGGRPLIWPSELTWVPGAPTPEFRRTSFLMMSNSPEVIVTVKPHGKGGLTDANGVSWTDHKIRLKPGKDSPFEQWVEIRKRAEGPLPEFLEVLAATPSGGNVTATVHAD